MTRLTLIAALLVGCTAATAESVPVATPAALEASTPAAVEASTPEDLARVDVRGTATSMQRALEHVQRMTRPPTNTRPAAQHLVVTCPFNRAAVQLPRAMLIEVMRIDADTLDPLIQSDWRYLQSGLTAHVAVLDALGADLPLPGPGDYLTDKLPPMAALTTADLAHHPHPVQATMSLLDAIGPIVEGYDAAMGHRLQIDRDVLASATGRDQLYLAEIQGWHGALRRLQPFVQDAPASDAVRVMIEALDVFRGNSC